MQEAFDRANELQNTPNEAISVVQTAIQNDRLTPVQIINYLDSLDILSNPLPAFTLLTSFSTALSSETTDSLLDTFIRLSVHFFTTVSHDLRWYECRSDLARLIRILGNHVSRHTDLDLLHCLKRSIEMFKYSMDTISTPRAAYAKALFAKQKYEEICLMAEVECIDFMPASEGMKIIDIQDYCTAVVEAARILQKWKITERYCLLALQSQSFTQSMTEVSVAQFYIFYALLAYGYIPRLSDKVAYYIPRKYRELGQIFKGIHVNEFNKKLESYRVQFEKDSVIELAQQLKFAHIDHCIKALQNAYVSIPLNTISRRIGCPDETSLVLERVYALINANLNAEIRTIQNVDYLCFKKTESSQEQFHQVNAQATLLEKYIQDVHHDVVKSQEYISRMLPDHME